MNDSQKTELMFRLVQMIANKLEISVTEIMLDYEEELYREKMEYELDRNTPAS